MNQQDKVNNNIGMYNLTDNELKKEVLDVNKEQLSIVRDMSYYYLFGRIADIKKHLEYNKLSYDFKIENEKEVINNSCRGIIEAFKKFQKKFIDEEVQNEIKVLINMREKLYSLSSSLYGYGIELSYIKELLDHNTMKIVGKKQYKNQNIKKEDINYLTNRIRSILTNSNIDDRSFISIVSNVLSMIPFRMTKYKYFDVLKTTLMRNFSNYPVSIVESKIEEYKMILNSTSLGDYGILFDGYFSNIQRLRNMNLKGKSLEDLEGINKDILVLDKNINEVETFIINLGIIINRLIALYLTKDKIALTSENKLDFIKWEQYEQNPNEELLGSLNRISKDKLEQKEKCLLQNMEYFGNLIQETSRRNFGNDKKVNYEIKYTGKILTYYNDIKFTKYETLFPEKIEIIESDYLEQLIDSLIQYINRSISSLSGLERKIRMRRLLSVIELPFEDIEKFIFYVEYSLDERVVSKEEIMFTIYALNNLIEDYSERLK